MDHDHLRLSNKWQELFFCNFIVLSMTIDLIHLPLCIFFFHLLDSLCFETSSVRVFIIIEIGITVLIIFFLSHLLLDLLALGIVHLFLHFNSFVFHSFLHHHFVEDATLHLHTGTSNLTSVVLHCIYFLSFVKFKFENLWKR